MPFAVIVPAGQGGDFAIPVVFDLDFRIDAKVRTPVSFSAVPPVPAPRIRPEGL